MLRAGPKRTPWRPPGSLVHTWSLYASFELQSHGESARPECEATKSVINTSFPFSLPLLTLTRGGPNHASWPLPNGKQAQRKNVDHSAYLQVRLWVTSPPGLTPPSSYKMAARTSIARITRALPKSSVAGLSTAAGLSPAAAASKLVGRNALATTPIARVARTASILEGMRQASTEAGAGSMVSRSDVCVHACLVYSYCFVECRPSERLLLPLWRKR